MAVRESNITGVLIRRGQDINNRPKDDSLQMEKTAIYQPRREASEEATRPTPCSWYSGQQNGEKYISAINPPIYGILLQASPAN